MAHSYNCFYIGNNRIAESDFFRTEPRLLTFSEVQHGTQTDTRQHTHTHLELFYCKNGIGIFDCEGTSTTVCAHDLIIVNAGHKHRLYSESDTPPLVCYNITIDRLKAESLADNCITAHAFEYHSLGNGENDYCHTIKKLLTELQTKQCDHYVKVNALFTELLIDIIRLFRVAHSTEEGEQKLNTKRLLLRTRAYIDGHYSENLSLEQLTRISLMQKSYFMHQFKKNFGVSPIKYLNQVRIENAKLLLINTEMSITDISVDVGFNTPAYFSEMFLKAVGMTPSHFRKRFSH